MLQDTTSGRKKNFSDSVCPICNKETESVDHISLNCDWIRAVWFESQFQWNSVSVPSGAFSCRIEGKLSILSKVDDDLRSKRALLFNTL